MRYTIVIFLLILMSCRQGGEHVHDENGGHIHAGDELPTVDTTIWTSRTELFVEYPALVVGNTSRFAAHFTILEGHRPVREGSVTVSLIKGNKGIRQTVGQPSSPGIFTPSLQPVAAGIHNLTFILNTPSYSDTIPVGSIMVYADVKEAEAALAGEGNEAQITFLKEQAWKIDFQTQRAREGVVFDIIPTYGVWQAAPSDMRTLVAASEGMVIFQADNLTEGREVKEGEVLLSLQSSGLTSKNIGAEIQKARAIYEQALSNYRRKKELYELQVVPRAEFEQAEQQYLVAKTTYENLAAGFSRGGKQVTAPFDGYLKAISVGNGEFVDEGEALITITRSQTSLLEARVTPSYTGKLDMIHEIYYQRDDGKWAGVIEKGGAVVSIEKAVGQNNPLISVYAKVNAPVTTPEGSFTEVQIAYGPPATATVVPVEAILEDYGNYSVIVQLSGESFEQRPVKTGGQNGSLVEIKKGLARGEMVVTRGAYQVKMASMSGAAPAHGHAH